MSYTRVYLILFLSYYFVQSALSQVNRETPNVSLLSGAEKFSSSDIVILDEQSLFQFYGDKSSVEKRMIVKINSAKGAAAFTSVRLPESFDIAYDLNYVKQGRLKRIQSPFVPDFQINKIEIRKLEAGQWKTLKHSIKFDKIRRIKPDGEFLNDEELVVLFPGGEPGGIYEIYYEASFSEEYGWNLFYFNSTYPKVRSSMSFSYGCSRTFLNYKFVLPELIPDTAVKTIFLPRNEYTVVTTQVVLRDLARLNYPSNSFEGNSLPHVCVDFTFHNSGIVSKYGSYYRRSYRSKNFEWMVQLDTAVDSRKSNDQQKLAIRKYVETVSKSAGDTGVAAYCKALCNSLNECRYITTNQLFYNESALYNLYSGDHLLKGRLVEQFANKIYSDALKEKGLFYYSVNVMDGRYGDHSPEKRAHYAYEKSMLAVPFKNTFLYITPRENGIKYHLNEMPYYFEGSVAAITAKNYPPGFQAKSKELFKIIKLPMATYNDNIRTEVASVSVRTDSLKISVKMKESLSGQFSTLLRHLYLKDCIDSTVPLSYYKRCVDKPGAENIQIASSSKSDVFPYRYTFNASESFKMANTKAIDLSNWFSFPFNSEVIREAPEHDFYFDFPFSDSYNYAFEFAHKVNILNIEKFARNISNEYYSLESQIVKTSDQNYLLKVKFAVKQIKLPHEKAGLLLQMVKDLDYLNTFSLELATLN